MDSHFIAFDHKVILTDELKIQCDNEFVTEICTGLVKAAERSYRPAYGEPRFYVRAEITRITFATNIDNGFELDEEDEVGRLHY